MKYLTYLLAGLLLGAITQLMLENCLVYYRFQLPFIRYLEREGYQKPSKITLFIWVGIVKNVIGYLLFNGLAFYYFRWIGFISIGYSCFRFSLVLTDFKVDKGMLQLFQLDYMDFLDEEAKVFTKYCISHFSTKGFHAPELLELYK